MISATESQVIWWIAESGCAVGGLLGLSIARDAHPRLLGRRNGWNSGRDCRRHCRRID